MTHQLSCISAQTNVCDLQQQPRLHRRDFLPSISRPLTKATTAKLFPSDKLQFVDSLFRTNEQAEAC